MATQLCPGAGLTPTPSTPSTTPCTRLISCSTTPTPRSSRSSSPPPKSTGKSIEAHQTCGLTELLQQGVEGNFEDIEDGRPNILLGVQQLCGERDQLRVQRGLQVINLYPVNNTISGLQPLHLYRVCVHLESSVGGRDV